MELKPVESSNIAAIGYDGDNAALYVQFTSGKTYEYPSVPPEVFAAFEKAESKGRFFAAEVRPKYQGTPWTPPTEGDQAEAPAAEA